jgi:FKBP-type peptidyl-prolyl cis-trans isomerase FkpA
MLKKYSSLLLATGLCLSVANVNAQATKKPAAKKAPVKKTTTATSKPATSTGGFTKGADNLDYKVITKGTGTVSPQIGDVIEVHIFQKLGDSLLMNSYNNNGGKPVPVMLQAPSIKGDLMGGIVKMKVGDSTLFKIPLDTLVARSGQPRPEWVKKNADILWGVKLVSIKSKAEVEAAQNAELKAQSETDDKLLQEYFAANNIKDAKKTASGLYYVVTKKGEGPMLMAGQKATVNYTGRNMQGEKFDSNVDPAFNHVTPFEFGVGQHQVIQGWDEGVALMNKGMQATFYIPSGMAYGSRARSEQIPANAILIFDIELVDFK